MTPSMLSPLKEAGQLPHVLDNLGFILANDHCRRNCLHCPAYGDSSPVLFMPFHRLAQLLDEIRQAYDALGITPLRSIASWRISDPLDYFVREGPQKRTIYDVAHLWKTSLRQGLYIVTNGSEGKSFAQHALRQFIDEPDLVSQIKLTITSCDQDYGTDKFLADLSEDVSILSPLWKLPSLRIESPQDTRFRINVKTTDETCDEMRSFLLKLFQSIGYSLEASQSLLHDPAKVAIKRIYDLTPEQNSPVIGAQSIINENKERYKAAPERENRFHHGLNLDGSIYARSPFQYGIDPSGFLFIANMPAFSTSPFCLNGTHMRLSGFEHEAIVEG